MMMMAMIIINNNNNNNNNIKTEENYNLKQQSNGSRCYGVHWRVS